MSRNEPPLTAYFRQVFEARRIPVRKPPLKVEYCSVSQYPSPPGTDGDVHCKTKVILMVNIKNVITSTRSKHSRYAKMKGTPFGQR